MKKLRKKSNKLFSEEVYWLAPDAELIHVNAIGGHLNAIPNIAKKYGLKGFSLKEIVQNGTDKFLEFMDTGFVRIFKRQKEISIKFSKIPNASQIFKIILMSKDVFNKNGTAYVSLFNLRKKSPAFRRG